VPVRKVDLYDGATPSANAVMAHNLWVCGMCMERSEWVARAGAMLASIADNAVRYSYSFSYWAMLLQRREAGMRTVVCSGQDAHAVRREIQQNYRPQAFFITYKKKYLICRWLKKNILLIKCILLFAPK